MEPRSELLYVSRHFVARATRRGLNTDIASFILRYGTEVPACGAVRVTIVEKDLPPEYRRADIVLRARDWVLVIEGSMLITCYRRRNALRYLRHVPRYRAECSDLMAA